MARTTILQSPDPHNPSSMLNNEDAHTKTMIFVNTRRKREQGIGLILFLFLLGIANLQSQFQYAGLRAVRNTTSAEFSNSDSDSQHDIDQMREIVAEAQAELATMAETIKTLQADKQDLLEKSKVRSEEEKKENMKENEADHELENVPRTDGNQLNSLFGPHEICSYFPTQPFTASIFWQEHLSKIFDASKNPLIPDLLTDEEDTIMHNLLENKLLPSRLRRAASHMPTFSPSSLKNVVKIIERRVQDPNNNPPLSIAVFGGSVTSGTRCFEKNKANVDCAWPKRLELLINQFIGIDVVKVYNLAAGGTDSDVGTTMVKYWMYPDELAIVGPDVIVHSYSTNDSWLPTEAKEEGVDPVTFVMDQARERLQNFIRAAMQSKGCDVQPLIVAVDDYVGPWQELLLGELSYSAIIKQVSRWYDTVAISYGDVVRDIAWFEGDKRFFNKKDVHNGHWAHQTMAWSVGFASLELLSNYCDDEYNARKSKENQVGDNSTAVSVSVSAPTADNDEVEKNSLFLPPPLTRDLLLHNATTEFNAALDIARRRHTNMNCSSSNNRYDKQNEHDGDAIIGKSPCIISWISKPGWCGPVKVKTFMTQFQTVNTGWYREYDKAEGWSNKVGLVPTQPNATLQLQFQNVAKDVGTVTIFFLRSYGEKWKDSLAKFRISSGNHTSDGGTGGTGGTNRTLAEVEISGFHNSSASLTLHQTIDLPEVVTKGETLNIQVDLISGNTFKIMGMSICR